MPAPKSDVPEGRKPVMIATLPNPPRIVVMCDDRTIWQRKLDGMNFSGGEKFVWERIEGPPAE